MKWLERLTPKDILQEYKKAGVNIVNDPDDKGWAACHSKFGDSPDEHPSAGVNVTSGVYKDFRADKTLNLPEMLAKVGDVSVKEATEYLLNKYKEKKKGEIRLVEWSDGIAANYCKAKPPCTIEGLHRSGAFMAMFGNTHCLSWDVISSLPQITGRYIVRSDGELLHGKMKSRLVKDKGVENGLFFEKLSSVDSFDVYWVEGGTDLVAGYSCQKDGALFVTNPSGCAERINDTQATFFQDNKQIDSLYIIGDSDIPGMAGARERVRTLKERSIVATHLILPYKIKQKHGEDLRDYLGSGAFQPNKALKDQLKEATSEDYKELDKKEVGQRKITAGLVMKDLGLHIVNQEFTNKVSLYSEHNARYRESLSLDNARYEAFADLMGTKFTRMVRRRGEQMDRRMEFFDFRNILSDYLGDAPQVAKQVAGPGIWNLNGKAFLVQQGMCHVFDGNLTLTNTPVQNNLLGLITMPCKWYDPETLDVFLATRHASKTSNIFTELQEILSTWPWEKKEMGLLAAGCFCASWLQDFWRWRPYVLLQGESATGKTSLLRLLRSLYCGLAVETASASAAGIRQQLVNTSKIALIDEIDATKEQQAILEMVRLASLGQRAVRGTSDQVGKTYLLRHLMWISGITCSSFHQADLNRQISLSLSRRSQGRFAELPDIECELLGHRCLAATLIVMPRALELEKSLRVPNLSPGVGGNGLGGEWARIWESYTVPYAMTGAMMGWSDTLARAYMEKAMEELVEKGLEERLEEAADHRQLLNDIMETTIRLPYGGEVSEMSVMGMMMKREGGEAIGTNEDILNLFGHRGVAFTSIEGVPHVALVSNKLVKHGGLLYGHERWRNHGGCRTLLLRNTEMGPREHTVKICGKNQRCVVISTNKLTGGD